MIVNGSCLFMFTIYPVLFCFLFATIIPKALERTCWIPALFGWIPVGSTSSFGEILDVSVNRKDSQMDQPTKYQYLVYGSPQFLVDSPAFLWSPCRSSRIFRSRICWLIPKMRLNHCGIHNDRAIYPHESTIWWLLCIRSKKVYTALDHCYCGWPWVTYDCGSHIIYRSPTWVRLKIMGISSKLASLSDTSKYCCL